MFDVLLLQNSDLIPNISGVSLGEVVEIGDFGSSRCVALELVLGRLSPGDVVDAISFVVVASEDDLTDQLLRHRGHENVVGFAGFV